MSHNIESSTKATWKEWFGLAVLTLAVFMLATDMSILYLAMPTIAADLEPTATQMLWIIHVGELLAVGFALTMGRMGDNIGRRRLLVIGVSVYGLASLLAAFSTSALMLILVRALLGIATATIMPSTMSLFRNMFKDPKQFSLAIAINLSAFGAGMSLGPPIGGLLLDTFWWGSIFLINVPVAALLVISSPVLPEYRNLGTKYMDLVSVLLSSTALIALVFGLQELANNGFNAMYISAVVIGAALGYMFIRRQKKSENPLLDLRLFKISRLTISLFIVSFVLFVTVGADMLFAQFLQAIKGLSPIEAGLYLIAPAISGTLGTLAAPILIRWMRPAFAMIFGLLIAIIGAVIVVTNIHDAPVVTLVVGLSLLGFGGGPAMTLTSEQIVGSVPQEKAGSASAISDVGTGLGSALSIALIGSIGMLIYRIIFTNTVPENASSEVVESAQESVGAAVTVAENSPGILEAVETSFSIAIQSVYGIAAFGFLLLIGFIYWKFRHVDVQKKEDIKDDFDRGQPDETWSPRLTESKEVIRSEMFNDIPKS